MCEIDWDGDGDDKWVWWENTPRIAKKKHRCGACCAPIRPGDPYLDHRHISRDDGFGANKACAACGISLVTFGEAHNFWTSPEGLETFLRECVVEDDGKGGWRDDLAGILKRRRIALRASRGEVGA